MVDVEVAVRREATKAERVADAVVGTEHGTTKAAVVVVENVGGITIHVEIPAKALSPSLPSFGVFAEGGRLVGENGGGEAVVQSAEGVAGCINVGRSETADDFLSLILGGEVIDIEVVAIDSIPNGIKRFLENRFIIFVK